MKYWTFSKQFEFQPTGEREKQQSDAVEVSDHDVLVFVSTLTDRLNRLLWNKLRGVETEN